MISKEIIYFGQKAIIACDEKCEKAWGINNRPRIQLDENDEDLGIAPIDTGIYEGGHAKPVLKIDRLNKWCCRECERCCKINSNGLDKPIKLKDFSIRVYNIPKD